MLRKVTISLTFCLLACLRGGAQDRSTPEATVRSFLTALARADIRQAAACVKGAQSSPAFLDAIAQQIQKDP